MWRIMHDQCVHHYHLQSVQLLQPNDHPKHADFAQWLMRNGLGDLGFPASVIFTEEESFSAVKKCSMLPINGLESLVTVLWDLNCYRLELTAGNI
ncbi:hypothetical protein TNCT_598651 [Trichonephila clavata]|uniref:Uncharacterized protein n=1 Tax=Trichonephila clavata TaxID=2740835 RepID=A0A8X6LV35_TRICU|nr:hypothetical protein TNCT_598651 [Trichonephila clavata]